MEVLLILGFLLFLVTVVGHGIWVFVAFIFRSLADPTPTAPPVAPTTTPKRTCPHCGAWCAATFQNCPTCGKPVAEQPPSLTKHLQNLQRQFDQLLSEDVLSREQFESVRVVLQQATDKFKTPDLEPLTEELPTLEAAEATEPVAANVGHVSNVPAKDGLVENVPHELHRSTWTDWLQAFLEEKNIRWGELLAGLLIVGSSVGLVISLWSTLRNAIPYFPALCFLAITAAIHGAGLYTLRHWRLKTTSRGLLTIALLLVPLNFLTAIALSEQRPATDPLYLAAVAIGVAAYGWITWSGTHELMHFGARWLSLSVLGSAIGQLMIGRLTTSGLSTLELHGLFALPLLSYVVALFGTSRSAARWRRFSSRRVEGLYRLLGIAVFSLCVALGLLLWKSQAILDTLSRLSPCVSLAAAMVVGVAGRLLPDVGQVFNVPVIRRHVGNVPHDIAATSVTLVGAMLMVIAVVLAWPDPERLIAVGVVNFLALSWFGFATGLAPLHVPALASLAIAGLIAFHRFGQAIGGAGITEERNLIATMLLGRSGVVLALMSLVTAIVARSLPCSGSPSHPAPLPGCGGEGDRSAARVSYLVAAAGMAIVSLAIAGYAGFWPQVVQPSIDRSLPTVVFLLFGIVGMVANERLNRIEIAWAGAVVWLAVFLHGLGWNTHLREWLDGFGLLPSRPIVVALLSFATWSLGCAIVGKFRNRFVAPWSAASGRAIVVALFAMPWKVWGDFGPHAIYLGWVAALCLGQAHLWQSRNLFSLSQAVGFIAASLGIASFAQHEDWWIAHGDDIAAILDVRHAHWQMAGLAMACVPWVMWRRFGGRWGVLARCSDWKVDRILLPMVVIASAVTMWFSLWRFMGFERYQRPEFWPVVLQPWIARGWDRVLLWLIGWGAVTWSLEEVSRRWFLRRGSVVNSSSVPIRFPWLAALGTLGVGVVMFLLPQIVWSGVSFSQRQQSVDPQVLFGHSMWWVAGAALLASGLALLERGRWQVRVLAIACWVALWQVASIELTDFIIDLRRSAQHDRRGWWLWLDGQVFSWSTIIALALLLGGGLCKWVWRRLVSETTVRRGEAIRDDVWAVVGWLCLLPVIVLAPQVLLSGPISEATWSLSLWTALLVWRAWRTRSAAVAFGASHAWCWIYAAIALTARVNEHFPNYLPPSEWSFVRFLAWSAVALGAFSWLWTYWRERWGPLEPAWWDWRGEPNTITPWLWQQHWSWACLVLSSVLAAWAILRRTVLLETTWPMSNEHVAHGAFALVAGSSWLAARNGRHRCHTLGLAAFAWMPVLAVSWMSLNRAAWFGGEWGPYHVWEVGWVTLAVVWSIVSCVLASGVASAPRFAVEPTGGLTPPRSPAAVMWCDVASLGAVLLALREIWFHQSVSWPAICVAVVAVSVAASALVNRSQWRVAASTACVVLATAMAWTHDWDGFRPHTARQLVHWWDACLTALGFSACAWQVVEVWWQNRRAGRFDERSEFATTHAAAGLALMTALTFAVVGLWEQSVELSARKDDGHGLGWSISDVGGWIMLLAVTSPFVVSCWDRFAKGSVPGFGLCGCVWLMLLLVMGSLELPFGQQWHVWASGMIAAEVVIVGTVWKLLNEWLDRGPSESHPLQDCWRQRRDSAERSLPDFQLVWVVLACVLNVLFVLTYSPRSLRLWSAASGTLLIPGVAALARSRRRAEFQQLALGLVSISVLNFLWAWMEPQPRADFWLQRSIRALEALALTAFVYGVGLVRVVRSESDWRPALQRAARGVSVAAIVVLMVVLSLEAWWFDPVNGSPVTGLQIALVAATLVGLAVALLAMALKDRQSEISHFKSQISDLKSEISNLKSEIPPSTAFFNPQTFVYAAEVVVALLFLHCYLTMPELFRGYLQPYWPLIVMAIAFAGVGASELCQRAKLNVLSEPLQNSAALFPLIPALGFWVATSRTDYSSVLFAAGLVYVWLNLRRRSFWYVLAASLAGNVGLWSLWSEHGVELLVRPQVWLIPPAISVLAAAQWNRQRLTEAQLAAIRYPAITLLYVSSAGEMFLTGIAESFWLPVVLMVLSVLGVLAGMWLRVRAFLYLGASFLLLSLVSMVWHAAAAIDHTWPWWAFGIGLGLGVLTLFGLFERKRNEMLRLLGELRTWER